MPRIFISYRRADTLDVTGRLHADLANSTGPKNVFKDVISIGSSEPFEQQIFRAISQCKYLIIMIGPRWLALTDDTGERQIDDPDDFPRREIVHAIKQNLNLVPVLVGDTVVPSRENLPEELHPILDWQFRRLRPDPDFARDAAQILKEVKNPKRYCKLLAATAALLLVAGTATIYFRQNTAAPQAACTTINAEQIKTAVDEGYSGLVYAGNLVDLSSTATNAFIDFYENSSDPTQSILSPPPYRLRYVKGAEEHTADNRRINTTKFTGDTPVAGELDIGIAEWQWNCGSPHTGWIKPPGDREGWNYNLLDEYHFDKANIQNQWQNKIARRVFDEDYDRVRRFNCATDAFIVIGESLVATIELRCDNETFHYRIHSFDNTSPEHITFPENSVHDVTSPEFVIGSPHAEIKLPFSIAGGRSGYIYKATDSETTILRVAEEDIKELDLRTLHDAFFSSR